MHVDMHVDARFGEKTVHELSIVAYVCTPDNIIADCCTSTNLSQEACNNIYLLVCDSSNVCPRV